MPICRFWQQGNCRYGDDCRFDHPRSQFAQSGNRFAPPQEGPSNMTNRAANTPTKYGITGDQIRKDLTVGLPQWILSCYAPGKDAPEQLFGGYPREQSFEELRLHYMNGVQAGNEQGARAELEQLYQTAQEQIQTVLSNVDGAVSFIVNAESKHPNRHDVCRQGGTSTGMFGVGKASMAGSTNAFGSGNAFGQPSTLGQRPNPFSALTSAPQPAFGQPSQPQPVFGQQSQPQPAFGQPSQPQPAFGQPSQPQSSFGQPSQTASGLTPSAQPQFGQPSFGQPSFGQPSFGQPTQPQPSFGQSTSLGARPSPFAQAQPGGTSFGQPSALGVKPNPFSSFANTSSNTAASPFAQAAPGASPFGQASTGNKASPFTQAVSNQASDLNQNGGAPSPFASISGTTSAGPFAPSTQQSSPSPFAPTQQIGPSPFAATQQTQSDPPKPSPFATTNHQQEFAANTFTQQSAPALSSGRLANGSATNGPQGVTTGGPYAPGSTRVHPPLPSYSSKLANGQLGQWKGQPVTYVQGTPGVDFRGGWIRIWFPNGPPAYMRDTELPDEAYGPEAKSQWASFVQSGKFDGNMPELAPKREFCVWDF